MAKDALKQAIKVAGSQSALARMLGVKQAHIWHWLNKTRHAVPAEQVLPIERGTGVRRGLLRPDLYPEDAEMIRQTLESGTTDANSPPGGS